MKPVASLLVAAALAAAAAGTVQAQGNPEAGKQKAIACAACHGSDGNAPEGQAFPDLAGQTVRYLYLQLKDFKEGRRKDPLMSPMAVTLSKEDMYDLAEYFSKQKHLPSDFQTDPAKVAEGKRVA